MRGSQLVKESAHKYDGIIPAHAGLTRIDITFNIMDWDHPRACGAHAKSLLVRRTITGSSPRMRGSLAHDVVKAGHFGIIPAHAGLTPTHTVERSTTRDHPRACGAHHASFPSSSQFGGSSPRMRGSLPRNCKSHLSHGIIPAHAGLTSSCDKPSSCLRDHPRACGAHRDAYISQTARRGSSPRMRGSRRVDIRPPDLPGIIPAHAGLTLFLIP